MKAIDIVRQLHAVIPRYTDLFSDDLSVSSLIRTGSIAICTTSSEHGLSTGNNVYITGAIAKMTITSLTYVTSIVIVENMTNITRTGHFAVAVTAANHDLTRDYQSTVTISGATPSGYNGEHNLIDVPNRRTFVYELSGALTTPATGAPKLLVNSKSGYNGFKTITVLNNTQFSYPIDTGLETPATGTIFARIGIRISGAVTLERAIESYTKQSTNDLWMFVVLGATSASKDRYTISDAINTSMINGADIRTRIIDPFSIFVFAPTTYEISGMETRDLMEDVATYLFKSILRVKFPTGLTNATNFGIAFAGHDLINYNTAYLIHEFRFENVYDLVYEDTVDSDDSVAFRDIQLNFNSYLEVDRHQIMGVKVDLDDQPL